MRPGSVRTAHTGGSWSHSGGPRRERARAKVTTFGGTSVPPMAAELYVVRHGQRRDSVDAEWPAVAAPERAWRLDYTGDTSHLDV